MEPYQNQHVEPIVSAWWADLSPDGRSFAYVRNGNVYRADTNGANETLLMKGGFEIYDLRWSPDGRSVGGIKSDLLSTVNHSIVTVDIATGKQTVMNHAFEVLSTTSIYRNGWNWNTNGTRIACFTYDSTYHLTVLSADGMGTVQRSFSASEYDWSSGGDRIAFLSKKKSYEDTMHLTVVDLISGDEHTFLSEPRILSSLQWTRNPSILAVNHSWTGVVLYNVDTMQPLDSLPVSNGITFDDPSYRISPDGTKVLYIYEHPPLSPDSFFPTQLMCLTVATGERKVIIESYPGLTYFQWFPDSKQIAYCYNGNLYKIPVL